MTTTMKTQKAFPTRFCKSLKYFENARFELVEGKKLTISVVLFHPVQKEKMTKWSIIVFPNLSFITEEYVQLASRTHGYFAYQKCQGSRLVHWTQRAAGGFRVQQTGKRGVPREALQQNRALLLAAYLFLACLTATQYPIKRTLKLLKLLEY